MPTYEYKCESCKHEWEDYHSITQEPVKVCPECGKETAKRLISGGSGRGVVTLYGADLAAKNKSDAKKMKKDMHNNELIYANLLGEDKYQQMQSRMDKNKAERNEKLKEMKKIKD
ncbi:MAG TPA: zinc ribbon domain-containing protein [Candidatus Glassbacteria bacterium]|nr:zinc ribbon domain-containing protein [Candidatus Glassbacteria bacterium]